MKERDNNVIKTKTPSRLFNIYDILCGTYHNTRSLFLRLKYVNQINL
jgi:hypothetical protein